QKTNQSTKTLFPKPIPNEAHQTGNGKKQKKDTKGNKSPQKKHKLMSFLNFCPSVPPKHQPKDTKGTKTDKET
ncbi:hypothetical protein, partial [uncultured Duncaniella sp.]